MRRLTFLAPVASAALAVSGCRACANDHPYVPPAAEAGVTEAPASAAPVTAERDSGAEPALTAPPGTTSWKVGGLTLEATGREILQAILGDFDGDGQKDALAIVREMPMKPGLSTGELVLFQGGHAAGALAAGPALGVQPSCAPTARLERIGRSAYAEIASSCPRGAGSRTLAVVRLGAAPAVSFDAVVVDPRESPRLTIDVDAADRDRDGLDDVVLRLALDGTPRVEGKLAFFDRPAGPSRDPEEPEASLKAIVAKLGGKSKEPVLPAVQQVRALYRAMCLEGGGPRITKIHQGSGVSCGASKALEDANLAEVRALAAQGDAIRAYAAAQVAQAAPATRTAAKTKELEKVLADLAPVVTVSVRTSGVVPDAPHDRHPEWGPLSFEPGGKLLVRHGKTVTRVDPETGEGDAADAIPWKDEVLSPDGKSRLLEAYHACEGVTLHATLAPTGDGDMADVLLPVPPRLGKTCTGRSESAPVIPVGWGAQGLEAIVSGHLVRIHDGKASALGAFGDDVPPQGSPRSPNGKAFALALDGGVLLAGRGKGWSMARSPDLEPYADLRRCTPSDDASRFACVRRGKVVIATVP